MSYVDGEAEAVVVVAVGVHMFQVVPFENHLSHIGCSKEVPALVAAAVGVHMIEVAPLECHFWKG